MLPRMMTRPERQRRWGATVAAAGLAAVAAAGIDAAVGGGSPPASWCQAKPDAAWRSLSAQQTVPLPRTTDAYPLALGPDARTFFAVVHTKQGFWGVAQVDAVDGKVTPIKAFPKGHPGAAAGGEFDGRWLVWTVSFGTDLSGWSIWAWDSQTGHLQRLAIAPQDVALGGPVVWNGIAAWTRPVHASDGGPPFAFKPPSVVHVYDLRTGRDRVVRSRYASGPLLFAGRLIAWSEGMGRSGGHRKLHVASVTSGKTIATPPVLRTAALGSLDTDGHEVAYTTGHQGIGKSLWWSPSLQQPAQMIARAPGRHTLDPPFQFGGRYLGIGMEPGLYVADTRLHRYLLVDSGWGSVFTGPHALLVSQPAPPRVQRYTRMRISVIPVRDVPAMPPCAG